jgi:cell division protein FtsL
MKRRPRPTAPPSKIIPAFFALAIVVAGFATLMVRLEVTQEGYRLSTLQIEIRNLETDNQRLRLETAGLESHQRLRALAPKYGLSAPAPGHVMMVP